MKNYYELLGLNRNASKEDIKGAYRKLSLKIHPDLNDGDTFFSELFKNINEANEILSNDLKRAEYDAVFFADPAEQKENTEQEDLLQRQFEEQKARERQEQKLKQQEEQKAREAKISMVGKMMEETYVPRKREVKKVSFPWFTLIFIVAIAVLAVKIYSKPQRPFSSPTEKSAVILKKKKKKMKDEYIADEKKLDEEMQRRNEDKIVTIDSEATNVNMGN